MSEATFTTRIVIKGESKDIINVFTLIKEEYVSGNDEYFESVVVRLLNDDKCLSNIDNLLRSSVNQIQNFATIAGGLEIEIEADGPYGCYGPLEDMGIFNRIAESVPNISLRGYADGYDIGGDQELSVVLENGILHYTCWNSSYEVLDEAYIPYFESILPLSKFCKIFKIVSDDEEEIIEDFYSFIRDVYPSLNEYLYEDFKQTFESNIEDEMAFKTSVEELKLLNIKDYETFCDEKCKFSFDYDTISGKYTYFDSNSNSIDENWDDSEE